MTLPVRPSVLLVVFDTLSTRDLQAHVHDLPNLAALLADCVNFTHAFACSPESGPARASLFTGLDMAAHGVWSDGVALPKRETPMPEIFAQSGYISWLVGRRQLAGVSGWTTEHARPREYHHFDWAHGPLHLSRQNAYLAWLKEKAPTTFADIFPHQANPGDTDIPDWQHDAIANLPDDLGFNTWVGQQACARIGPAPFFGMASFVVGQTKGSRGTCPEAFDPRALKQSDAALGAILNTVPAGTIIALTAGRGSGTGDCLADSAIHVPLALRVPGFGARTVSETVSTMDVAPTLYRLAQRPAPQRLQGTCLITDEPRGWALSRLRQPDHPHRTALMSQGWKLVTTHDDTQCAHLFDLSADPNETNDLANAAEHSGRVEQMIDQMIDARVALEDRTEPRVAMF